MGGDTTYIDNTTTGFKMKAAFIAHNAHNFNDFTAAEQYDLYNLHAVIDGQSIELGTAEFTYEGTCEEFKVCVKEADAMRHLGFYDVAQLGAAVYQTIFSNMRENEFYSDAFYNDAGTKILLRINLPE